MLNLLCDIKQLLLVSIAVVAVMPQQALARDGGICQQTQLSPKIQSITAMDELSAQPSQNKAPAELDHFAQALLDQAIRLAREIESPEERAKALINSNTRGYPESIYRFLEEPYRAIWEEGYQAILQIDSVVVRIQQLGELAGNYQYDRDRAIALLQEAEQLLPSLSERPNERDYALMELSSHYVALEEEQKGDALIEDLSASFKEQLAQYAMTGAVFYGNSLKLDNPNDSFIPEQQLDCCEDEIEEEWLAIRTGIRFAPPTDSFIPEQRLDYALDEAGEEWSEEETEADEAEQIRELERLAREHIQAERLEEAETVLAKLQALISELPLGRDRFNAQVDLASFFQDVHGDRMRWSAVLTDAIATFKQIQSRSGSQSDDSQSESLFSSYALMQITDMLRELDRTEEVIDLLQAPPTQEEPAQDQRERLLLLATAHGEMSQTDAALEVLRQAAQLSHSEPEAWGEYYPTDQIRYQIQVAGKYLLLKQPEAAWQMLEPILRMVQSVDLLTAQADIDYDDQLAMFEYLVESERLEAAIAFAQTLNLEEPIPNLVLNLAKQDKFEMAVQLTQQLEYNQFAAKAWTNLAVAYEASHQPEAAEYALDQAVAAAPNDRSERVSNLVQILEDYLLQDQAELYETAWD